METPSLTPRHAGSASRLCVAVPSPSGRGAAFARQDGMAQDDLGIWSPPGDAKAARFEEPGGNTLSLTQFASL